MTLQSVARGAYQRTLHSTQHLSARRVSRPYSSIIISRSHQAGLASNISITLMIILGISIVVGSVVGYSFLVVNHPSATDTTPHNSITTHTTTHSTTFSSTKGQPQTNSTTSSQTTSSTSVTNTRTVSTTSGLTTDSTTITGTQTGTVTSSSVTTSTEKTSISSTTKSTTLAETPTSEVEILGTVSMTGTGTRLGSIQFQGEGNFYTPSIVGNAFSISLPNDETYLVSIVWNGAYSWQKGTSFQPLELYENQSTVSVSWQLQTPDSTVEVLGNIATTGTGTYATQVAFASTHGVYNQTVSQGEYVVSIPNDDNYNVSARWNGEYVWQTGSSIVGTLNLTTTSIVTSNWSLQTPNSMVTLSGNLTASGIGTRPTNMTFVHGNVSSYTTSIVGTHYSISLPNEATYSVSVGWTGEYQLANGECQRGRIFA